MKTMKTKKRLTQEELKEILKKHKLWHDQKEGGEQARFDGMVINELDFTDANLSGASFVGATIKNSDFYSAQMDTVNFSHAHIENSHFGSTNISSSIFNSAWINCSFKKATFNNCDFNNSHLHRCDFDEAGVYGCSFKTAYIGNSTFENTRLVVTSFVETIFYKTVFNNNLNTATIFTNSNFEEIEKPPYIPMSCPEEGSFIGYKAARGFIIKLLISEDARRSSGTGRECRCDKAKVLSISNFDGSDAQITSIPSKRDNTFIYEVGKIIEEPNFCEDRFKECAEGIHFFINREEAINYGQLH